MTVPKTKKFPGGVTLYGFLEAQYSGKHLCLRRGPRERSKHVRLPRDPRLVGSLVSVTISIVKV